MRLELPTTQMGRRQLVVRSEKQQPVTVFGPTGSMKKSNERWSVFLNEVFPNVENASKPFELRIWVVSPALDMQLTTCRRMKL
jgi:hypothetical protein